MDNVVSNIAENILLTMTLTKITITRINREALRKLFVEIEEYALTEKYETTEEKLTFLNYTKLPPFFIAMIGCSMSLEEVLLTEELENNFNFPIMQQLMGSSMHICISGYYVLTV
ncbi:hypothetical protein HZH68_017146 [Vespula germanica]|uniref:Uncharacterized protein n=1 Tax=Vespula germanica TaxID=30212 RepID=A0A834J0Y2_VESGE|nr:hypothetical protein HZH68_017146 [Vespula germanica]